MLRDHLQRMLHTVLDQVQHQRNMLRLRRWLCVHDPCKSWMARLDARIREDEDVYLFFRKW